MSQVVYRGNLSSAYFPLLASLHGRSVIVGQSDNNFNRQLQSTNDLDKDIGIPQLYYAHNVLPTEHGVKAVGYITRIDSVSGESGVTQRFTLRDDNVGKKVYLAKTVSGFYVAEQESSGYTSFESTYVQSPAATLGQFPDLNALNITVAHVQGISYLCIEGTDVLTFNFTTKKFNRATLIGLSISAVKGITESNGYLIAYSNNSVTWSSLINPLDFVPSLETGAGGGSVEGAKGNIAVAVPTADGFVVMTEFNAVSVLYTNNAVYPFQFSECTGAGGITNTELITFEAQENNYAYTSKGLQILKRRAAETIMPAVTDFLGGDLFEDFDVATNTFSEIVLSLPLRKKLTSVSSRYLVMSYGVTELTHALVYDTVQKRMGKLRIPHVDCFEYELTDKVVGDLPKNTIAFLDRTGKISTVTFDQSKPTFSAPDSVALLGKYQYVRSRFIELQKVELENIDFAASSVFCLTSWDGKSTNETRAGVVIHQLGRLLSIGFGSPVGVSHSLVVKGKFDLNSIILSFTVHGATM